MINPHALEFHLHCVRIQLHSPGVKALTWEQFSKLMQEIYYANEQDKANYWISKCRPVVGVYE